MHFIWNYNHYFAKTMGIFRGARAALTINCLHTSLHLVEQEYVLNCKINSTNGGTFSNSAGKILVSFFWFTGP